MSDLVSGAEIGQYILNDKIGEGGMGVVFSATQPSMSRAVAIKFLAQLDDDDDSQRRFDREARMIALLEHPHILPVYAYGHHKRTPYIVMRFIPGGTLSERLKKGQLTIDQIVRCLTQISEALDYAHKSGIIHRDLKPANVFFDEQENAYLGDFGLAKTISGTYDLTKTDEGITGTPDYMSPEQVRGMRLDGRTDVYSLAIIAYQSLVGRPPFVGKNPMEIVLQHLSAPVPKMEEVGSLMPDSLDPVFIKALAKDPQDRYQSAREFVAALNHALEDVVAMAVPEASENPSDYTPQTVIRTDFGLKDREQTVKTDPGRRTNYHTPMEDIWAAETTRDDSMVRPTEQNMERPRQVGAGLLFGRPLWVWIGGASLVIVLAVLAWLYLNRNPLANTPQTTYAIDSGPRSVVIDSTDQVWTVNYDANSLSLFGRCSSDDPSCLDAIATVPTLQRPVAIAASDTLVYVGHQLDNNLLVMDLSGERQGIIPLPSVVNDLLWTHDHLWVTMDDSLLKLTAMGDEVARFPINRTLTSLTAADDRLWVVSEREGTLSAINLENNEPLFTTSIGANPGELVDLAYGSGFIWATLSQQNLLLKIDPDSGEVLTSREVGLQPLGVAVGGGYVWVSDHQDQEVIALDAETVDPVGNFIVSGAPSALYFDDCGGPCQALWVTVEQTNQLVRASLDDFIGR
ncbi:MAG: protein kinase [Ardenticatenaceae bacterium]|nr:protein kinase [Ardenticatenaceae bacterium]